MTIAPPGWIKLHRSLLNWEWYDDPNTVRLLIHLLITVNHEPSRYHGHTVPAGSRVAGRMALAAEIGLSERAIRTALEHLLASGEVTIKTTNKFSIISMTKWEQMQDNRPAERPASDQSNDQPATNNRPHLKNERNKEEKNTSASVVPDWVPCKDWVDFIASRRKLGKLTDRAIELLLLDLDKLRLDGHPPSAVLQQSIKRGWKGLFPLKEEDLSALKPAPAAFDRSAFPAWQLPFLDAQGEAFVRAWLKDARLADGVLYVKNQFTADRLKNQHGQQLREAAIKEVRTEGARP